MFRRPKNEETEPQEHPDEDRRDNTRLAPFDTDELRVWLQPWREETTAGQVDECLVVQLDAPLDEDVTGKLEDLCIQGASVRVQRREIAGLDQEHVIALRLVHPQEGWQVVTPCQVRAIHRTDSNMARVGLEFVNPGNLYAQLHDGLGRYFNRRGADRVEVESSLPELRMKARGTRLSVHLYDLSVVGFGGWVDHVLAAQVRQDDEMTFTMHLPGDEKPIEGSGRIARKVPQGRVDYLGVEFDHRGGTLDLERALRVEDFVRQFLSARLRWSA